MIDPGLSRDDLSGLIQRFAAGQTELFGEIVEGYYFDDLVNVATHLLRHHRVRDAAYQGEDAAGEAVAKLWQAAAGGKFPAIQDDNGFWALLCWNLKGVILHKGEALATRKRGGRRVPKSLDDLQSQQLTPAELALAQLECEALLDQLDDPLLATIAAKRFEGYTNPEIARQLQKPLCFVDRRLSSIRSIWRTADPGPAC